MSDYDLPLLQKDLTELEKRGFILQDELSQKYVNYPGVLDQVKPKSAGKMAGPAMLHKAVVRLQAAWRGRQGRVEAAAKKARAGHQLGAVGDTAQALRQNDP